MRIGRYRTRWDRDVCRRDAATSVFAFRRGRAGNVFARHLLVSIFASVRKHVADKKVNYTCFHKIFLICFCVILWVIFIFIVVNCHIIHISSVNFRVYFTILSSQRYRSAHFSYSTDYQLRTFSTCENSTLYATDSCKTDTYDDCPISVRLYVVPVACPSFDLRFSCWSQNFNGAYSLWHCCTTGRCKQRSVDIFC